MAMERPPDAIHYRERQRVRVHWPSQWGCEVPGVEPTQARVQGALLSFALLVPVQMCPIRSMFVV